MPRIIFTMLILLCWSPAYLAAADLYPMRPIRIIVPIAPGGGTDITARLVAAKIGEEFGQPVVVDNRPGGASIIGTLVVASATPDGYTLGMVTSGHVVNPFAYKLPYDTVKDFEPINNLVLMQGILATHPSLQVANVNELISMAKKRPGMLLYAVPSALTNGHVTMEMLKIAANVDITPVVYRGGAPAVTAVLSGEAQLFIIAPMPVLAHIQSGRLKALATTGARRMKGMENIPTLSESGFPELETYEWYGMLAPARTPQSVISKLNSAIGRALKKEDVVQRLATLGAEPVGMGPEDFRAFMNRQLAKMKALSQRVKLGEN